jgi:hypothetical protein
MMNLIDEIEKHLEEPEWEHWYFHSIKRTINNHDIPQWAVYIAYNDGGDPRGLSIVSRGESLYQALRDMVIVVSNGTPADSAWY